MVIKRLRGYSIPPKERSQTIRQDQLPYFSKAQIGVNERWKSVGNGNGTEIKDTGEYKGAWTNWYEPDTLNIASTGFDRKQDQAQVASGAPRISPNRFSNGYLNIKEMCKSIIFLPTELKRELINYFERFARAGTVVEAKAMDFDMLQDGKDTWLTTVDPLNFEKKYGLGSSSYDLFDYMYTQKSASHETPEVKGQNDISHEIGHSSFGFPEITRGFYGFQVGDYTKRLQKGGLSTSNGGWFDDRSDNPWFATYSKISIRTSGYDQE